MTNLGAQCPDHWCYDSLTMPCTDTKCHYDSPHYCAKNSETGEIYAGGSSIRKKKKTWNMKVPHATKLDYSCRHFWIHILKYSANFCKHFLFWINPSIPTMDHDPTVHGRNPAPVGSISVSPIIYELFFFPGGEGFRPLSVSPSSTTLSSLGEKKTRSLPRSFGLCAI